MKYPESLNKTLINWLTLLVAVAITLLVPELAIRVYHGKVFNFSGQLNNIPNRLDQLRADYHPQLGWVPSIEANDRDGVETITHARLRSNGSTVQSAKRPILTVGDSFTFGDEVSDRATWPAQLERLLGVPVLNGGVFAYGLDQAYLSATLLLKEYHPTCVILAFIKHDISRTQFSYYSAWKPYYEYDDGALLLRNTPVPRLPPPKPRAVWLRTLLSYSFLASALMRSAAPRWWFYEWYEGSVEQVHTDGNAIATELISRLQEAVRGSDAQLLVLALSSGGKIGNNKGMPVIVEGLRQRGVEVLDLVSEIEQKLGDGEEYLFMPNGHYSPQLNGWVAARVAEYLRAPTRKGRCTSG